MRTLILKRMVRRLEGLADSTGPCPYCAGRAPILLRGEQAAPVCSVCGRGFPAVKLVRDSNFFGNALRLRQGGAESSEQGPRVVIYVPDDARNPTPALPGDDAAKPS
jgi:hypothetical protein